jgi:hypothetical protein
MIMAIHGNMIINGPLMSSMAIRGCKNGNVVPKGRHREPIIIIAPIFDHKDGHYVGPNRIVLEYLDLKKMLI